MVPVNLSTGRQYRGISTLLLNVLAMTHGYRGQDSEPWREVKPGWVPDHYAAQIQHQPKVSGTRLAYLWMFDGMRGLLRPIEPIGQAMHRIREG